MSVGIENVFNLSNRDARTSSAERLYTYVQLYRHIQHASRTRSSRHDPAIVAHAADAADNAIVAPGDHAPAAKSTKSTKSKHPQPATHTTLVRARSGRPSWPTATGRHREPAGGQAPAARGGCRGLTRRARNGGNSCGWRPHRPRPPSSPPRSCRARRVLQTHRTRTNQQGCRESGQGRKCTRAVRGRWATGAGPRRDAHGTPSKSSGRSTTPAHSDQSKIIKKPDPSSGGTGVWRAFLGVDHWISGFNGLFSGPGAHARQS
jgi:hypothetical protein